MKSRDLMFPALMFLGGAVVGRVIGGKVIGVKPLIKGALTATNFGYSPGDLARNVAQKTVRKASRRVRKATNVKTARKPTAKSPARRVAASRRPIQKKSTAV